MINDVTFFVAVVTRRGVLFPPTSRARPHYPQRQCQSTLTRAYETFADKELRIRSGEAWLFLFAVILSAVLLFTSVFFVRLSRFLWLIVSTDTAPRSSCLAISNATSQSCPHLSSTRVLTCRVTRNSLNPIDLCNKLNQVCQPLVTPIVS